MPTSLYLQLSQRDVITEDEKLTLLRMFGLLKSFAANQEMAAQGGRGRVPALSRVAAILAARHNTRT